MPHPDCYLAFPDVPQTLFCMKSSQTQPVKILSNVSGVLKPVRPSAL